MDLLNSINISGTGLSANRIKMNVIAQNLANSETTRTSEGGPYRRKMVVFKSKPHFLQNLKNITPGNKQTNLFRTHMKHFDTIKDNIKESRKMYGGVNAAKVVKSQDDFNMVHNPAHPDADPVTGYVAMPNVSLLSEVADMIVAKRAYDANVTAISNTKSMVLKALEIGK